jgi:hypothetical protein
MKSKGVWLWGGFFHKYWMIKPFSGKPTSIEMIDIKMQKHLIINMFLDWNLDDEWWQGFLQHCLWSGCWRGGIPLRGLLLLSSCWSISPYST